MQHSTSDSAIHPSLGRLLQNCTSSDDACTNDSTSIDDDIGSNILTVVLLTAFAIAMVYSGLRVFCVDIPRDRNNAREKARNRKDLIENGLIKKRVKRPLVGETGDDDLEKGLGPRNCRLQKLDLILPVLNDGGGVHEDEELMCPICWEEYEENDEICYSPNPRCDHAFHFDCIKPWLKEHDRCPICRMNYLHISIDGEGINIQSLGTTIYRDEQDRIFQERLVSRIESRQEQIESNAVIGEGQREEVELASEVGDTSESFSRETEQNASLRPSY